MHEHLLVDARPRPVYDLGVDHPFARHRQKPLFELLEAMDLFDEDELFDPPSATIAQLHGAHLKDYVAAIMGLSMDPPDPEWRARATEFGMDNDDNPVAPNQHQAAAAAAGATLHCVRAVVENRARRAFNPTGGLHHALPGRASGFCIYNDLVVGIQEAKHLGVERILYLDFDVHHGDGVEFAFRDDPQVMTVSFHESPDSLWPGTGRASEGGVGRGEGFARNVPFAMGVGDHQWIPKVVETVEEVAREFRPQLIVSQHGCDSHYSDPLAHLECTTEAFLAAARATARMADEVCGGKWVATGGGGYQPYSVIPRAWAIVWCVLSRREVPERLDEGWLAKWESVAGTHLPSMFLDR